PDGSLFFTETKNQKIGRVTTTGVVTESAGTGVAPPLGITNGRDGFLYFTESGASGRLGRVNADLTGFSDASQTFNDPQGILTGPDGFLYVAEAGNNSIDKIARADIFNPAVPTKFPVGVAPQELVIGPNGFI